MDNEEIIENPSEETQEEAIIEEPVVEEEPKKETLKLPEKEDDSVEIDGIKYPKEIVEKARAEGWTDRDYLKNRGKENIYLDPETFLERGKKFLPFVNKKVEQKDEEISILKKMLQKKIEDDTKDKVDNVEKQLKEAKDYGNYDDVEILVEKRAQLKNELDSFKETNIPISPPPQFEKPIEMVAWETKNTWCFDKSNPYNVKKTEEANRLFNEISNQRPDLDLQTRLLLVDHNLIEFDNKIHQRANVSPPIQSQSTSIVTPNNRKTIENLTSGARKIFDDCTIGCDGERFTGKALEIAKKSFLESARDEFFKK